MLLKKCSYDIPFYHNFSCFFFLGKKPVSWYDVFNKMWYRIRIILIGPFSLLTFYTCTVEKHLKDQLRIVCLGIFPNKQHSLKRFKLFDIPTSVFFSFYIIIPMKIELMLLTSLLRYFCRKIFTYYYL